LVESLFLERNQSVKERNVAIILYHGSNQIVIHPRNDKNKSSNDFGAGFYLTCDKARAINMAKRKAKYVGTPILNTYVFNCNLGDLKILSLKQDVSWVKFVLLNRTQKYSCNYDIVRGPTADGKLYFVLKNWKNGKLDLNQALILLKPNVYPNQFCFKTMKAINYLEFIQKEIV